MTHTKVQTYPYCCINVRYIYNTNISELYKNLNSIHTHTLTQLYAKYSFSKQEGIYMHELFKHRSIHWCMDMGYNILIITN